MASSWRSRRRRTGARTHVSRCWTWPRGGCCTRTSSATDAVAWTSARTVTARRAGLLPAGLGDQGLGRPLGEKSCSAPRVAGTRHGIAFSPDGRLLEPAPRTGRSCSGTPTTARSSERRSRSRPAPIDPISFSPDGRLLAASSVDETASLWDLRARRRLGKSFPPRQGVIPTAGQFAPDGDLVIDCFGDGAKWPTDPRKWQRFACQAAGRDLTPRSGTTSCPIGTTGGSARLRWRARPRVIRRFLWIEQEPVPSGCKSSGRDRLRLERLPTAGPQCVAQLRDGVAVTHRCRDRGGVTAGSRVTRCHRPRRIARAERRPGNHVPRTQ